MIANLRLGSRINGCIPFKKNLELDKMKTMMIYLLIKPEDLNSLLIKMLVKVKKPTKAQMRHSKFMITGED
jgi:hypothetical protein